MDTCTSKFLELGYNGESVVISCQLRITDYKIKLNVGDIGLYISKENGPKREEKEDGEVMSTESSTIIVIVS